MEINLTELWIFLDVIVAALLSGIVGWEREKVEKPAGLKTNMIVGSISCYFVANSNHLINWVSQGQSESNLSIDPLRLIQAIVIGVSFIGAGTIVKSPEKSTVLFLTTAAILLYSAAIGVSVALCQYLLAVGLSFVLFLQ
jgi:putative Mg2+ transporter-C (MgtC) family protein